MSSVSLWVLTFLLHGFLGFGPGAPNGTGAVHFPISCSAATQSEFDRSVILLHSFSFATALTKFHSLAQQEPDCAMIYWGLAMSMFQPLGEPPDAYGVREARAALTRARHARRTSKREKDYIQGLAVLFDDLNEENFDSRVQAYAKALERLSEAYPHDREAAAFQAIALLGCALRNGADSAGRAKAVAILERLSSEEPNHPGVLHYLIHAYDDPLHASLGLDAARRYAQIAPPLSHTLHMPSHIFNRLGLWHESIESNLAAIAATHITGESHGNELFHQLHPIDYLHYAYLQVGREDEAGKLLESLKAAHTLQPGATNYQLAVLSARHALELRNWQGASSLELVADSDPWTREIVYWARAVGAAHIANMQILRDSLKELKNLEADLTRADPAYGKRPDPYQSEAAAWLAHGLGDELQAIELLRTTANYEESVGGEQIKIPAREMLADLFLDTGHPAEALVEYKASLRIAPGRYNSLYGAAVAAEATGDRMSARHFFLQLSDACNNDMSRSGRPELSYARSFLKQYSFL